MDKAKAVKTLQRRLSHLEARIAEADAVGKDLTYDKEEVSAIRYMIEDRVPPRSAWPFATDVCSTCLHTYDRHNYSDSAMSETDPLGHMYECLGEGLAGAPDCCKCQKFVMQKGK